MLLQSSREVSRESVTDKLTDGDIFEFIILPYYLKSQEI